MYVVGFGAVGIGRLLLTLKVDNFMVLPPSPTSGTS